MIRESILCTSKGTAGQCQSLQPGADRARQRTGTVCVFMPLVRRLARGADRRADRCATALEHQTQKLAKVREIERLRGYQRQTLSKHLDTSG